MFTFQDLYKHLKSVKLDGLKDWLSEPWVGKDKQESLLRLYAGLKLIPKLNEYDLCNGNFNAGSVNQCTSYDFFFNDDAPINLKDKGDKSDLHMIKGKTILATTSKNLNVEHIGDLDIREISDIYQKNYKPYGWTLQLCLCTRSTIRTRAMISRTEECNRDITEMLQAAIFIDWIDLIDAHQLFLRLYTTDSFRDVLCNIKPLIQFKMHQKLGALKTINMKKSGVKSVLWGHIPRSGKSYIMAGCIHLDSFKKSKCNYLIITTAPNETIQQYVEVFNDARLRKFKINVINGQNPKPVLGRKNIIICSKQFLQNKRIEWLKRIKFNMRFLDESHNGGTTDLAKDMLNNYDGDAFTVYITATYLKPVTDYNIPRVNWILWDLEDVSLCCDPLKWKLLESKHGDCFHKVMQDRNPKDIIAEYSRYPKLWILTDEITPETTKEIISRTKNNSYGWSTDACFLLKQGIENEKRILINEFQNQDENLKLWYRIFGRVDEYGIPHSDYPCENVFMSRIKRICRNAVINSTLDKTLVIMAFLPPINISKTSIAVTKLLIENNVIPDYNIISINSKDVSNPKKAIIDARIIARNQGKKGLLVLSGRQCSLGVSIHGCDVVLMLNNTASFDSIYQMMFRSMTEAEGKSCGFVVDLNIHRVINASTQYASIVKPQFHPKEALTYLLDERLINLNGDHWMKCFGHLESVEHIATILYNIYKSDTESALSHLLDRIHFNEIVLSSEERKVFSLSFTPTKNIKKLVLEHKDSQIQKGIDKTSINNDLSNNDCINDDFSSDVNDEIIDETNIKSTQSKYQHILKHVIPLVCLLTIHSEESAFNAMFKIINEDKNLYDILLTQTKSWWGSNINKQLFDKLIIIYNRHITMTTDQIIRTIKELFVDNIDNSNELSAVIDKYLIPQELEKKENAEVSTPKSLRDEMLGLVEDEFWKTPKKILEPSSGKGGFLVDIIGKFMTHLEVPIEDRYRVIVEECLYWCDINPTNVFICKLLIDPFNKYNLKYHLGDTLKLNTKLIWGVERFDAIIGNPPYSTNPSLQNAMPLYHLFTEKFIDCCDILIYVIPSRWFSGGKGLDKFRKAMAVRRDLKMIKHIDNAKIWFPNVEIKGGVNYFIKDSSWNGNCLFNGIDYNLQKYDIIIEPKYHNIIDLVKDLPSITRIYITSGFFKYRTNDKRLKEEGLIKCYISKIKSKNRCKYIDDFEPNNENSFWKVITSRAAHGAYSGFGEMFIGGIDEIHTDSYISFKVESKEEADSLLSYLKTGFANHMLSIRKITQDISENTCKWIPLVPLDRQWNDELICEYLNINKSW